MWPLNKIAQTVFSSAIDDRWRWRWGEPRLELVEALVFEGEEGHGQEEEFALQGEQTLLPEEVSEPGKTLAFEETLGPGLADAS